MLYYFLKSHLNFGVKLLMAGGTFVWCCFSSLAFMSDINKVHIAAPLDDEDFIEFFKKELKRRRFDANKYSYVKRVSEICPEKS